MGVDCTFWQQGANMAKIERENLPPEVHSTWDSYRALLQAAAPHNSELQTLTSYRQLVGQWGGFVNQAAKGQINRNLIGSLQNTVRRVLTDLSSLGSAVPRAVSPALQAFQSALATL